MEEPSRTPRRLPEGQEHAGAFASAQEDSHHAGLDPETQQTLSPAYKLGYADLDFMMRDELRAARLQLEYLKPEIMQRDRGITSTVVIFGSARVPDPERIGALLEEVTRAAAADPDDPQAARREKTVRALANKARYYEQARKLGQLISTPPAAPAEDAATTCANGQPRHRRRLVVVTGGGPGIMEAANRGATDVGAETVGLNIVLPFEQMPNAYVTPHLCFNFHYFALRKMHFMMRAKALVVFPGGFGTLDELFEVLCLIQTRKIKPIPVLLFGREYWQRIINFQALVEEGVVEAHELDIFSYVESAEEAWALLEPTLNGSSGKP
jgi:uncharacterized protein (TIGR00730 family)